MAKSTRLSEIEAHRAHSGASLSDGCFWEHWFDMESQNQKPLSLHAQDEHSIWERAVNFEILALDEKK
ncbi:MAG: hypothetical protein ACREE6_01170 [Limisphaerales bacterium]